MPTTTISVREVQQGLTYWSNVESRGITDDAPLPGRIDNRWGPLTHDALRAYVAHHAGRHGGYDSARVLAPLRSVPARTSEIELEQYFVSRLQTHAVLYRNLPRGGRRTPAREEPGRVRPPPDRPTPAGGGATTNGNPSGRARESSSSAGPALAIGAVVVAAAAAAAVAWSRRDTKPDEAPPDDELLETEWA